MIEIAEPYYLSINKDELAALPQAHFQGDIVVVDKEDEVSSAIDVLRSAPLIGFDTETRPSFKRGHANKVALMQLSAGDTCYLFRLNEIGFVEQLKDLLEDKSVVKVGASVHDDYLNLNKLAPFNPDGFIDVQQYVKQFKIEDNSLARIYGILFGERISKNQRLTNWEQTTLTAGQQSYAALDAYACTRIYQYLQSGVFDPAESPYIKHHEEEPTEE
jgi:ribonuclease D